MAAAKRSKPGVGTNARVKPASAMDVSNALAALAQDLKAAHPDFDSMASHFSGHLGTSFLQDYLLLLLDAIARDPDLPIPGIAGQVSFTLINCPEFNYTIRLIPPFKAKSHAVRCLRARQMLGIKGGGTARFRRLRPTDGATVLVPGTRFEIKDEIIIESGSAISSSSDEEVLDLWQADEPIVIEALSVHIRRNRLYWHLTDDLKVHYAECGSIAASRLQNALDLARAMRQPIPSELYDHVLEGCDVQEKLCAIRSLLWQDRERGFRELHLAIASDDPELSVAAESLFAALLQAA